MIKILEQNWLLFEMVKRVFDKVVVQVSINIHGIIIKCHSDLPIGIVISDRENQLNWHFDFSMVVDT